MRPVLAAACAFAAAYAGVGLFRHWRFGSGAYDLGIFDQLLWHLSRFEGPASSVRGLSNLFGDHFDPILLLMVPVYWVAPAPETLILVQSLLLASSIEPVWRCARDRLTPGPALAIAVAYGSFWGLQRAAYFDFHDYAFAPLLIATLILAIDRGWWKTVWMSAVAIVFVKEDLIPIIAAAGILVAATRHRSHGLALFAFGVASFVLVVGVVIPALSDSGTYEYAGVYSATLREPWSVALQVVTPPRKLQTVLFWLLPFAFLPLLSPVILLSVPLVLSRLLSDTPSHWSYGFHYSAPLAPILAMSAADGLARVARWRAFSQQPRALTTLASACVVLATFTPGHQPIFELLKPAHYAKTDVHRSGEQALRLVPANASVVAQSPLVPHLTHRQHVYVLGPHAPESDYVVACTGLSPWPFGSDAEIDAALIRRQQQGYQVMFAENGWTVLRR
jgi:uncharacterized membrane protein